MSKRTRSIPRPIEPRRRKNKPKTPSRKQHVISELISSKTYNPNEDSLNSDFDNNELEEEKSESVIIQHKVSRKTKKRDKKLKEKEISNNQLSLQITEFQKGLFDRMDKMTGIFERIAKSFESGSHFPPPPVFN
jgi:hypothetical protein